MIAEIQNSTLDKGNAPSTRGRFALRNRYTKLFHNLEHGALAVAGRRTGQQSANSVDGLARPANHTAHISASELQFKRERSAAGNFRQHHVIRKFDQLANHELQKFSHRSKD
jgi:hypothetical protein